MSKKDTQINQLGFDFQSIGKHELMSFILLERKENLAHQVTIRHMKEEMDAATKRMHGKDCEIVGIRSEIRDMTTTKVFSEQELQTNKVAHQQFRTETQRKLELAVATVSLEEECNKRLSASAYQAKILEDDNTY